MKKALVFFFVLVILFSPINASEILPLTPELFVPDIKVAQTAVFSGQNLPVQANLLELVNTEVLFCWQRQKINQSATLTVESGQLVLLTPAVSKQPEVWRLQAYSQKLNQVVLETAVTVYPDKLLVVDAAQQHFYAYASGQLVLDGLVSTGRAGTATSLGWQVISEKKKRAKYVDKDGSGWCWMTYYQEFNHWGQALHGIGEGTKGYAAYEKFLGKAVSHGCIRIRRDQAEWLYGWTELGTPLLVIKGFDGQLGPVVAKMKPAK